MKWNAGRLHPVFFTFLRTGQVCRLCIYKLPLPKKYRLEVYAKWIFTWSEHHSRRCFTFHTILETWHAPLVLLLINTTSRSNFQDDEHRKWYHIRYMTSSSSSSRLTRSGCSSLLRILSFLALVTNASSKNHYPTMYIGEKSLIIIMWSRLPATQWSLGMLVIWIFRSDCGVGCICERRAISTPTAPPISHLSLLILSPDRKGAACAINGLWRSSYPHIPLFLHIPPFRLCTSASICEKRTNETTRHACTHFYVSTKWPLLSRRRREAKLSSYRKIINSRI